MTDKNGRVIDSAMGDVLFVDEGICISEQLRQQLKHGL